MSRYILGIHSLYTDLAMKKLINFKTEGMIKDIQAFADKHFEGNFSQAVRMLIIRGLSNG